MKNLAHFQKGSFLKNQLGYIFVWHQFQHSWSVTMATMLSCGVEFYQGFCKQMLVPHLRVKTYTFATSSAYSAVTWCNHMPHWWHGSCSYKLSITPPIINHRPFTHLVPPYTGYWWLCNADYFLYGSCNWYKLIRLGRVSCPRASMRNYHPVNRLWQHAYIHARTHINISSFDVTLYFSINFTDDVFDVRLRVISRLV